jgi:DNA-binding beta-propeller fold protein YncE
MSTTLHSRDVAPVTRLAPLTILLLNSLVCTGCAGRAAPTFSLAGTSRVWPAPPDRPRIRYLGEITGEASLGVRRDALAGLRAVLEGPPPEVRLSTPVAVAVTGNRLYVADAAHPAGPVIHVLDLDARTWSQLREAGGAPLQWPIDVAVAPGGGKLAVADAKRPAVCILEPGGRPLATIGGDRLRRPAGLAWRGDDELWVLDAAAHAILVFDAAGRERKRFGARGAAPGEFNFPSGLCSVSRGSAAAATTGGDAGAASPAAVVADAMNFRVQLLDDTGRPLHVFGRKGDAAGDFSLPRDVAVDAAGPIYGLDNQFENVQIVDAAGHLLMALGRGGSGPGEFSLPSGITIDAQDRIWIADTYNRRVQAFEFLREAAP